MRLFEIAPLKLLLIPLVPLAAIGVVDLVSSTESCACKIMTPDEIERAHRNAQPPPPPAPIGPKTAAPA